MARFSREDGFSLAELIIVIAIVAMVAAAVFGVYDVSQKIYIRSTSLEDAQLSARAGLDRMAIELRLAGAYLSGAATALDPYVSTDPCATTDASAPPPLPPAICAANSTSITFMGDVNGDTLSSGAEPKAEINVATPYSSGTSLAVNRATGIDGTTNPFCSRPNPDNLASCLTPTVLKYIYALTGPRREVGQIASTYSSGTTLALAAALKYDYPVGSIVRTVETVTYTLTAYASCPTPLPSISGMSCLTRSVDGGAAQTLVENVTVTGLTLTYYDSAGAEIAYTDIDAPTTTEQANRDTIREISISLTTQGNDGSRRTMTSRVRPRSLGFVQE